MQLESVTTPFGRRPMTLGMLASQHRAREISPDQSVDKWKIFRAVCEAKPLLGISDRALAVLNALLSFYPGNELTIEHGLVVFPSNAQLSLRAHGIAPATLRRHLAALIEAGLLVRKDSPNGKRFARRDGEGEVNQAYGFSIAPLIARSSEIKALAAQVSADRELFRATKERLSLCRRDTSKLIETALEEGVPGDWTMVYSHFRGLVDQIPRSPSLHEIASIVEEMEMLRQEVLNVLEARVNLQKMIANESQNERHIQNSKPESTFDLEQAMKTKIDESITDNEFTSVETTTQHINGLDKRVRRGEQSATRSADTGLKSFPLGLVLRACPEIEAYGPGGQVGSWRDLMAAAVVVRSMLGVSPSAYEDASAIMGPENAATVIACLLEKAGSITSTGGYLRDLTRRTERGEFAIGPMLMALARGSSASSRKAG